MTEVCGPVLKILHGVINYPQCSMLVQHTSTNVTDEDYAIPLWLSAISSTAVWSTKIGQAFIGNNHAALRICAR